MYGESDSSNAIARDMNSLLHTSTFKHPSNIKELISSDLYSNINHDNNHNYNQSQNQNQNQNQNQSHNQNQNDQLPSLGRQTQTSLMRYRSAPSAFYANLLDESGCDDFLASDASNHEPEDKIFFKQQQPPPPLYQQQLHPNSHELSRYPQSPTSMKIETNVESGIHKADYATPVSTITMYNGNSYQQGSHLSQNNHNNIYNNHNNDNNNNDQLGSSSTFRSINSTSSNLVRQSSSPAGFLSSLNTEINGFAAMRGAENKMNSSSRLSNHIDFTSEPTSSPMLLPQIPENRNEISDSTFGNLKRTREGGSKVLQRQNGISGHYTPSLVHHMSLPKTSSEMLTAEKYLRFEQDDNVVPCKTRAKRGFATHPRSIAERVRRTRISARMKKLQELFPTIDKNTSTADMLDLSVQYIKDLQKDLQTLKDARSRCKCSSTE
uniref:transcription factor bHLH130-like n=1 Tax=Erigeron canadensis TaxID=72917 RepID=UPI001CB90E89|nr:transcription factor bHLH130-like [Erigeron canadensis]